MAPFMPSAIPWSADETVRRLARPDAGRTACGLHWVQRPFRNRYTKQSPLAVDPLEKQIKIDRGRAETEKSLQLHHAILNTRGRGKCGGQQQRVRQVNP